MASPSVRAVQQTIFNRDDLFFQMRLCEIRLDKDSKNTWHVEKA
tara:strand:- start:752 stop:883 length:132 start_codon:yes stop_codon:yes gene_type:complete